MLKRLNLFSLFVGLPFSNHTIIHSSPHNATNSIDKNVTTMHLLRKRHSDIDDSNCSESTIMSTLVQNASPFLFPCTIEYSLICAVILYEMWKNIKSIPNIERHRRNSIKPQLLHIAQRTSAHHFSVDCSRAHRGMFGGEFYGEKNPGEMKYTDFHFLY